MQINKDYVWKKFLETENVTKTAKAICSELNVKYTEQHRKNFSRIINNKKKELGLKEKNEEYFNTEINHQIENGKVEIRSIYSKAPHPDDIIKDHKIDTKKWKLSNFWSKQVSGGWRVSALFSQLNQQDVFKQKFSEFLKTYTPKYQAKFKKEENSLPKGTLLVNKQDAHLNKKDEYHGGNNDIIDRFKHYFSTLEKSVQDVTKVASLDKVVYVIGSDHFNSEITGATVKGTPQSNILSYHTSFQLICDHEVKIIDYLLSKSDKVDVMYLIGNHDACVSFHLASWLKVYFREESRVTIDISPEFTKYITIYDSIICVNHGDVQKPEKLAQNFMYEVKDKVAEANYYYIITGDKHHESSKDFGAIKWYQIAASSTAKSTWDKQMGHTTTPALLTSFLIRPNEGASLIVKKQL